VRADAEDYEEYKLSIMESEYDRGTKTLVEAIDEADSRIAATDC